MTEQESRGALPEWIPERIAELYWSEFDARNADPEDLVAQIAKLDQRESPELRAALNQCGEAFLAQRRASIGAQRRLLEAELKDAQRYLRAREALFRDPGLEDFWRNCSSRLPHREMPMLYQALLWFIGFFPESGVATRDRPDRKIKMLDRQKDTDRLRHDLATKAREMVRVLGEVEDLPPAKWPDTSLGALLNRRFELHPVDPDALIPRLYSHRIDRAREVHQPFPPLREILSRFADRLEAFPDAKAVFADDPYTSSPKSTWRDFVRVASYHLSASDCRCIKGEPFVIREVDWVSLLNALFLDGPNRGAVNACLRELRGFQAGKIEE